MISKDKFKKELDSLKQIQKDINLLLSNELSVKMLDHFTIQRLKKSKLLIKDNISELESKIYPDIIA